MSLWIGSYGEKGGGGLYPLVRRGSHLDAGVPEPRIANASYAIWSDLHQLAYLVNEQDEGRVGTWRSGVSWKQVGNGPSGGALPCYLALSADGQLLACANYGDGTVTLFRIDPQTGAPGLAVGSYRPQGRGVDSERQDGPHAHCVMFDDDNRALYHVDLGLDLVFRHELSAGQIVSSGPAFVAPPGSGPRHLALHPDGEHALLICELTAQLLLLRREANRFACVQISATVPQPTGRENLGATWLSQPTTASW